MIETLKISNFRSVEDQTVDLAPLTFLYGNNAAGKSSLFYAMNVLRNVVGNPNQPLDSFFNLGFANLGSFKQVVFKHEEDRTINVAVTTTSQDIRVTYGVKLGQKKGEFALELGAPYSLKLELPVTFPYASSGNVEGSITLKDSVYKVTWNGLVSQVTPITANEESTRQAKSITSTMNRIVEMIRTIDLVPLKRGFTKPYYSQVSVTQFPNTEDDVASLLITDEYLDGKVNTYLEETVDRQFRLKNQPGTTLVALTTIEKDSRITTDLVNDGFGINQIVFLLAKVLNKGAHSLCIEEPEVNLHPGIIRRLPKTFIEVAKEEKKQLLVSTHSEILVFSVLAAVAEKEISIGDLRFYLTQRSQKGVTVFERQEISEDGQVEGGLTSFMTGELKEIKTFFKSTSKRKTAPKLNSDKPEDEIILAKEESQSPTQDESPIV